jgi:uncharacterized membrane protein (UPF0136 family)
VFDVSRRHRIASLTLLLGFVGACGNGSPGTDAGDAADVGDDGGADVPTAAPPVLTPCPEGWVETPADGPDGVATCDPWPGGGPAVLTPCPDGWREVTDPETGTVTCDPWPETGSEECAAIDEAHFPGEPGCTRVGTACAPGDDWATDLPGDRPVRYVLAGAPAGGEGTRAAPFGAIQEAMSGAPAGTVVALSKGTFDEVVILAAGVTLWGACVAETVVASSVTADDAGTLNVWGRDAEVRNLRVSGARPGIWASGRFRTAVVRDVVIDEAAMFGVMAGHEAVVTGLGIVVRSTGSRESDRTFGRGLNAQSGAQVEVARAVLERNRQGAVAAFDAGTTIRIADAVVRDTRSRESDRTFGRGLSAMEGARVEAVRTVLERNLDVGVFAQDAGTVVRLVDSIVRDTGGREVDRAGGRGSSVSVGARLELERVLLERNGQSGVVALDAGTVVRLVDVVVRDTRSDDGDGTGGRGLSVQEGARLEAERAVFERNREAGVYVSGAGTTVRLAGVVVRDTRSEESGDGFGRGLAVQQGAQVEAERALFERNREAAVAVAHAGTSLRLADAVVRDTQSRASDRGGGRGLNVQDGAHVEAARALFERQREVGLFVGHLGSTVLLADTVVRDTLPAERLGNFGTGVSACLGGHVEFRRFLVTGNALCGIQLAHGLDESGRLSEHGGTMDLYDGVVSRNAVCGANVQTAAFDLRRLQNDVRWHDNGIDLDTTEMPVPEASVPAM